MILRGTFGADTLITTWDSVLNACALTFEEDFTCEGSEIPTLDVSTGLRVHPNERSKMKEKAKSLRNRVLIFYPLKKRSVNWVMNTYLSEIFNQTCRDSHSETP